MPNRRPKAEASLAVAEQLEDDIIDAFKEGHGLGCPSTLYDALRYEQQSGWRFLSNATSLLPRHFQRVNNFLNGARRHFFLPITAEEIIKRKS